MKPGRAVTRVAVGGRISNRKGVNLPDTEIPVAAMTEKDRTDLEAAIDAGVDWIGMSFVQRPEDVAEGRKMARGRALIMTKLEKPQAISRLDDILDASDAVMVARGDLGVEMPLEKVPGLQKRITRAARRLGKPVVIATQMLESMITAPGADPRRGVGRRDRGLRGRRRRHALGRERLRPVPGRGGPDDEPHRRGGRARPDLLVDHHGAAERARGDGLRRDRRRLAPDRRRAEPQGRHGVDLLGLDGAQASPASARTRPCWP